MPRRRPARVEDEPVVLALRRVRQLGIIPRSATGGWVPQAPTPAGAGADPYHVDRVDDEASDSDGDGDARNDGDGSDDRDDGDGSDDRDDSDDGDDSDGSDDGDDSDGSDDGVAASSDVRHGAHRSTRPPLGRRLLWTVADHLPATVRAGVVAASPRAVGALALVGVLAVGLGGFHVWRSQPTGQLAPAAEVLVDGRPVGDGTATGTGAAPGAATAAAGMEPTAGTEPTAEAGDAAAAAPTTVVVHVAGRVHRPGIVELPAGARVAEAIDAAGGVTDEADTTRVNLARVLVDGEQVLVLAPDEDPPPGTGAPPVAGAPPAAGAAPGAGAAAGAGAQAGTTAAVVDLNTATLADLETLPGVGPVLAQRILDWRTANGRFSSVDELREISGLGEKRIADLRGKVRV